MGLGRRSARRAISNGAVWAVLRPHGPGPCYCIYLPPLESSELSVSDGQWPTVCKYDLLLYNCPADSEPFSRDGKYGPLINCRLRRFSLLCRVTSASAPDVFPASVDSACSTAGTEPGIEGDSSRPRCSQPTTRRPLRLFFKHTNAQYGRSLPCSGVFSR